MVKGIFVILILVFIGWGVGSFDDPQLTAAVAVVNGVPITNAELAQAHQSLQRTYQELYGAAYSPALLEQLDLQGRALDELITAALLLTEAERLGLRVSDKEIAEEIKGTFSPDGRFDKGAYLRFLRAVQLTDEEFVERQRKALLIRKVESLTTDGARVSDDELRDRYQIDNQQVNLRYAKIPRQTEREQVALAEADVTAYYEAHQDRFHSPERVSFAYVAYRPGDFEHDVTPTESEIADHYARYVDERFTAPEEVRLRQLTLAVPPGADDAARAAVRASAEKLAAQARDGDFAALARKHSSHKASAAAGGEIGWIARPALTPALATAAFALEAGAVSAPVEQVDAFYVFKVEEKRGPQPRPLDDVRDDIVKSLRIEGGRRLARDAAQQDVGRIAAGSTLEDVAGGRGVRVEQVGPLTARDVDPALGPVANLVAAAERLDRGETSGALELASGFAILRLTDRVPASPLPLADARPQVEDTLRAERAQKLAAEKAKELHARLQETKDLDALAAAEQLKPEETGAFGRPGPSVPTLGIVDGLKDDAFALKPEAPVAPRVYTTGSGDPVLVVLKERIATDLTDFEEKKDTLRDSYVQRKKQALLAAFIAELKRSAKIDVQAMLPPKT
jgi:peptidyl-prolyl cis-trans isomerase D